MLRKEVRVMVNEAVQRLFAFLISYTRNNVTTNV